MPPLSIMIKPSSSLCNMRCKYCFYSDVAANRTVKSYGMMNTRTAENIIRSALDFAAGESVSFAFQGGEPLLSGIEFFEFFTRKVRELNTRKSPIYYGIQTNGTLINAKWADFFTKNEFLVGLSLDGNFAANKFRLDADGKNSYYRITRAANILTRHKTEFNILTVLTGFCADNCEEIYKYMRKSGFKYLQFIPCLRPFGDKSESELYMTSEQYSQFLIRVFNLYVKDFVRNQYVSIRYFDNLVRMYLGQPPEQCGMCGHCSHQFVVEGDGSVYPCDFYCVDEYFLGNINALSLEEMANSDTAVDFIKESLKTDEKCRACEYYPLCRAGGCKRQREDADYCEAYKKFFSSCLPLFRAFGK